jgi:hypothetical protein
MRLVGVVGNDVVTQLGLVGALCAMAVVEDDANYSDEGEEEDNDASNDTSDSGRCEGHFGRCCSVLLKFCVVMVGVK